MSRGLSILAVLWLLPASAQDKAQGLPVELPDLKRAVDFAQDVQPILKSACLACHNAKDASGDLILETIPQMLKGGETGPAVVPGKADESLLLKTAAHRVKPFMPPPKNKIGAKPLTPRELGLLKLWIDQGAKGAATAAVHIPPPQLRPMPGGWNPIYAVALDADGEFVACGRAGRLSIYHVPGRVLLDAPVDPKLSALGPVAHADSVQSLAFSPDGTLLASGGYRSIKIWKRERPSRALKIDGDVALAAVSADGARAAAVVGSDVRLIDLSNGKTTATVKGPAADLAFSPDGTHLLTTAEKTLAAWKTADGAEAGKVELPGPATALAWSADGKQVAAGFEDGVVRVWPWPPGAPKELKAHQGKVTDIAAVGAGFLTAGADGKARLWDADKAVREAGHGGPIVAVAATPDGRRWLTLGDNKLAKLWDGESAKPIADLRTDGSARKADRETAAAAAFAGGEVKYREGRLKAAEDGKKKEEEEAKKAADAVGPAEKAAQERDEAYAKAKAAHAEADKALKAVEAEAAAARSKAEGAAGAIAQAATDAGLASLEKAHGALLTPGETEKKAVDEARARLQKADEALAQAKAAGPAAPDTAAMEKALAEAQKSYDEAKAQLAAAKDDDAKKKAEALLQERRARRNEARDKLAAAKAVPDKASLEKALAEAQKVYDEAKAQLAAAKDDDAKKKAE
ncbi:MAG TPA: c-type cytochrome domain-containing protein, partial [Planctomycetota bacterium]|nr:c-type cytochrome domain-containing protein [Planctomycetota bacterium]